MRRGTVKVEPYDARWMEEFEREKLRLLQVFGDKIIQIEHIGSTSVEGLCAKPVIDMVAGVKNFDELPYFVELLQKLGYEYIPERMMGDRKFFPKGERDNRTHHLNIVIINNPDQWVAPLAFRDYLTSHGDVRNEYANLKQDLAIKYSKNRDSYTKAKNTFIKSVLAKAT